MAASLRNLLLDLPNILEETKDFLIDVVEKTVLPFAIVVLCIFGAIRTYRLVYRKLYPPTARDNYLEALYLLDQQSSAGIGGSSSSSRNNNYWARHHSLFLRRARQRPRRGLFLTRSSPIVSFSTAMASSSATATTTTTTAAAATNQEQQEKSYQEQAIVLLQKSIQQDPEYVDPLVTLATLYLHGSNLLEEDDNNNSNNSDKTDPIENAMTVIQRGLRLNPKHEELKLLHQEAKLLWREKRKNQNDNQNNNNNNNRSNLNKQHAKMVQVGTFASYGSCRPRR